MLRDSDFFDVLDMKIRNRSVKLNCTPINSLQISLPHSCGIFPLVSKEYQTFLKSKFKDLYELATRYGCGIRKQSMAIGYSYAI